MKLRSVREHGVPHRFAVMQRGRADRWMSGLAGSALVALASRMTALPALGVAALGGLLIGRGLSARRVGRAVEDDTCAGVDCVDEAGKESFPASDPPSWSPTSVGAPDRRTHPS